MAFGQRAGEGNMHSGYVGTTGVAVDYSQLSNFRSDSAGHTDATISLHSLAPNVNMLQGTYIWIYVEHEGGATWGEEVISGKRETPGEQSEGQNCNVT